MTTLATTPHLCIIASAGSGKTYRLSTQFIDLIARGETPSRILASTFTRLAAGEIRDRVLTRLAEAALADPGARPMLRRVASSIDRLQVRTLDGFFAGVVRTCALDLGLPPDPGIIDEATGVLLRASAVSRLLETTDAERLLELLRVLTEGGAERQVATSIDDACAALLDIYRESGPAAWQWMQRRPLLSRAALDAAVSDLAAAVPTAHGHHLRQHAKDVARVRAGAVDDVNAWGGFAGSGLVQRVIDGEPYYKKPIESVVAGAYRPLIGHAAAVIWNHLAWRTATTGKLLARLDACLDAEKRARAAVTFSDLTTLMVRAQATASWDEIAFRLDASVRHLLLDEFQDTSAVQWRALAPIAREIVADGSGDHTFFCVGDLKQSIYGWRDAAPEILANLPELIAGPHGREAIEVMPLAKSYRSAPVIVETINRVFTDLATNPALEKRADAAARWRENFHEHTTVKETPRGSAELRVAAASGETARLAEAAAIAADLTRREPGATIGVLVRSNKAVGRVLFELSPARLDVPASGRGGGAMTDAAAVNAVLDLLRLADHPDHTIAAFHVARSPLGRVVGLDDHRSRRRRVELGRHVRACLLADGYAATLQAWAFAIAPACDRRELARLHQLVELAAAFDETPALRPAAFVDLALATAVDDPSGAPITVMNVHQSKGLEFDAVILPDLEWKIGAPSGVRVAVDRDGPAGPITAVVSWIRSGMRAVLPELEPLFVRHAQEVAREDLSLLYVAITRAKRRLVAVIDPDQGKTGFKGTPAGLIRAALAPAEPVTAGAVLFRDGDELPVPVADKSEPTLFDTIPAEPARVARAAGTRPARARRAPSAHGDPATRLVDALRLDRRGATDRGTAIHALLEQVQWLDRFAPGRAGLTSIARAAAPRRPEGWAETQVTRFLATLEMPAIRELLAHREGWTVRREHGYARIVDGSVEQGRIDRLEIRVQGRKVTGARVIDFKTDEFGQGELEAKVELYRAQVETYRVAVAEQLGMKVGEVEGVLAFVLMGIVAAL